MNKQLAEFIGTFALVFFGCGAAVVGGMGSGPTAVNLLGIASAFGFAIVAMAYGIGPISGCHVNPAVSFGVFVAGRMSASEMIGYWIAQVLGAIIGAAVSTSSCRARRRGGPVASARTAGAQAISASTTWSRPSCSKWSAR
jgi:aquaporin Z